MSRFMDLENHEIGNTLESISFFRSQIELYLLVYMHIYREITMDT